jgi:hypothetical protein
MYTPTTPMFWKASPARARRYPAPGTGPSRKSEHVARRILEPRAAGRTELGDEVDRLRRLVLLERDPARGEIADDGLDIGDLEVHHGLTAGTGLPAPDRELRSPAGTEPAACRGLLEQGEAQLVLVERFRPVDVRHHQGRHCKELGQHRRHLSHENVADIVGPWLGVPRCDGASMSVGVPPVRAVVSRRNGPRPLAGECSARTVSCPCRPDGMPAIERRVTMEASGRSCCHPADGSHGTRSRPRP